MPNSDKQPQFSQIYIYDSEMQTTIRTGLFPKSIKAAILNIIQNLLNQYNPYVQIYKQAGELIRKDPSISLNIVLKSNTSKDKTFNKPTSNEIAVLMINGDESGINKRDVIVTKKTGVEQYPHMFISENLAYYDPLGYTLMHINGEDGWQYNKYEKNIKQKNK